MAKLSKEEIIRLYKIPNSLTYEEIARSSGFFTSVVTVRKCVKEAIEEGIITEDDEKVFEQRKLEKQKEKEKKDKIIYIASINKFREIKTREKIRKEIEQEYAINTSTTQIGTMLIKAIDDGVIEKEEYDNIINKIRKNAQSKRNLEKKEEQER